MRLIRTVVARAGLGLGNRRTIPELIDFEQAALELACRGATPADDSLVTRVLADVFDALYAVCVLQDELVRSEATTQATPQPPVNRRVHYQRESGPAAPTEVRERLEIDVEQLRRPSNLQARFTPDHCGARALMPRIELDNRDRSEPLIEHLVKCARTEERIDVYSRFDRRARPKRGERRPFGIAREDGERTAFIQTP